ncbi:MAG: 16S rRNA (guanine(527)-N(7))-methyltransferase RsmG [Steroidobacteraceae bacterium]
MSERASEAQRLQRGAAALGIMLEALQIEQLQQLLDELTRWNRAYNLTAVTERGAMLTHHLLDSLSAAAALQGEHIADVGTGGGFPGLPLAVLFPARRFTLIDSNSKKLRFVAHAARTLGLGNVATRHARAESLHEPIPGGTVVTRAYAALPELVSSIAGLCAASTLVLAMKGRYPADEIAALPPGWRLIDAQRIAVPQLDAERHLIRLAPPPAAAPAGGHAAALPAGSAR